MVNTEPKDRSSPSSINSKMSRSDPARQGDRAKSLLPDDNTASWQPPAASAQYREAFTQSQAHIRPGADSADEPKDPPDKMLINFLRSNETYEVAQSGDPQEVRKTSQGLLREILGDNRWTRRMVEDFYNSINPSLGGLGTCLTPYPVHRTLYLVLLNALEDQQKSRADTGRITNTEPEFVKAEFAEFMGSGDST